MRDVIPWRIKPLVVPGSEAAGLIVGQSFRQQGAVPQPLHLRAEDQPWYEIPHAGEVWHP